MPETVLVTGANGHLGLNVCQLLLQRGLKVRAMSRSDMGDRYLQKIAHPNLSVVRADLLATTSLDAAVAGASVVFHLGAPNKVWAANQDEAIVRPIIEGSRNIVTAAIKHQVRHFIFASSCSTAGVHASPTKPIHESMWYDAARSPLIASKTKAEQICQSLADQFALRMCSILMPAVVGPGFYRHTPNTVLYQHALKSKAPPLPHFGCHMLDVRDAAEAFYLAYKHQASGRYIAAGEFMTSAGLMRTLKKVDRNLKVPQKTLPQFTLPPLLMIDIIRHKLTGHPRELTWEILHDFIGKEQHVSTQKIRSEWGWQSRPASTTLKDTLDWIRQHDIDPLS